MRRAADLPCVFTGRPADHLHHPSGTDADDNYLDPALVLPLALPQHISEHVALNLTLFGDGSDLPPDALRLRRNAHLLMRLIDHHCSEDLSLPTAYLGELALMMHDIARNLESA